MTPERAVFYLTAAFLWGLVVYGLINLGRGIARADRLAEYLRRVDTARHPVHFAINSATDVVCDRWNHGERTTGSPRLVSCEACRAHPRFREYLRHLAPDVTAQTHSGATDTWSARRRVELSEIPEAWDDDRRPHA